MMPNWCFNHITISGSMREIRRFIRMNTGKPIQWPAGFSASGEELYPATPDGPAYFCLNALVPCPQSVVALGYDTIRCGNPEDGYHWCINHWGTKWDVYFQKITPKQMGYKPGCSYLDFRFETANKVPVAWFLRVAEAFPLLQITMESSLPDSLKGFTLDAYAGQVDITNWSDARKRMEFFGELMEGE